jgi:hypothetical protein
MIEDENLEETRVGLPVYKQYLKYLGGWKFVILSQLSMVGFIVFKVLSDYQVGHWATAEDQATNFSYYCVLSFLYACVNSLFIYCRGAVL